ncbi:mitochondrial carrier domain-containing protein [Radiomyces spectabilis]|uniref:mitochondrial carrier domain-containing protein n=1 Tax=Radiomyces spectabilis TaxID=64574 RepID=UPI00221F15BC|nr:mitochondrial carrier domain-containing protein [Radiomyces spectabilis]KAI8367535.1 mitochondrial carrier domain-containing protein [Radiomyces spectabilis]
MKTEAASSDASPSSPETRHVHPLPYKTIVEELLWVNRTILAASSAAVVGVIAGYPFDSVKTRMQTQPYASITACVKQTYKEEGIRGFFRGVIPPLITVSIIKSVSFSVYEQTKAWGKKMYPETLNQNTLQSTMAIATLGGCISGAFIATFSCPFELVKIQKQLEFLLQASSISTGVTVVRSAPDHDVKSWPKSTVNNTVGAGLPIAPTAKPPPASPSSTSTSSCSTITSTSISSSKALFSDTPVMNSIPRAQPHTTTITKRKSSTSSWHSAREIVRKKGFFGLYHGFGLHFGTGVYFGGYETTKYLLTRQNQAAGPLTQFVAGGVCGILCWLVVFPMDLVKSIIQKETLSPHPSYKSVSDCVKDIYKFKGASGFYRGITVTLIRAFPIHSLNFLVYEQTLVLVRHLSNHSEPVSL